MRVYDDFAHHRRRFTPLDGLRRQIGDRPHILAILEPPLNTMRMGVHAGQLAVSLAGRIMCGCLHRRGSAGTRPRCCQSRHGHVLTVRSQSLTKVAAMAASGDQVLIMSNGGFRGSIQRLLDALAG